MAETSAHLDLMPWEPVQTHIPGEWMELINRLALQAKGLPHTYLMGTRYDAQRVGTLLQSWGVPWQVAVAGYLWEHDEKQILEGDLYDVDRVLSHIKEANLYAGYIKDEVLPPLLAPPYRDLGALLIALAIYYQVLRILQEQSKDRSYTGTIQSRIETIGRCLLNIATRLGMWYFKREVEDLVEQLRSPHKFAEAKQQHAYILEQDSFMIEDTRQLLMTFYREATQQDILVVPKACGITGMKRRLQDAHTTATSQKTQLTGFDLVTFDIIVPTVRACYSAFGIFSQLGYIHDRVTDLIANPKANGCSHIAFGLVMKPQGSYTQGLKWPETYTHICQLEISTYLMEAIVWYGCLYPRCYQLYMKIPQKEEITPPSVIELWNSAEGRVFVTIAEDLTRAQPEAKTPIVVYDKNHRPFALPKGATALDFAYAFDNTAGEYAAEALINNRKAPLYRILDAGDIVEIRTSSEIQAQDYWLDKNYARNSITRRRISESLHRRFLDRRGYKLLIQELERYHYILPPQALNEELQQFVKKYNLGIPQTYLEQLDKEGEVRYTPAWAAQEIMHQIDERNESLLENAGRPGWVPVLDMQLTANKKLFHQQRLCGFCQPIYPRDMKIMGRLRKHSGELIVHKESCPHLIERSNNHRSTLLPMIWQLQPPAFHIAFFIKAQDRRGLILDLTRELRHHQCDLLNINAEVIHKSREAHIRFAIEAHAYKGVLDLWQELYKIDNILKVEIDAAATPTRVRDQLQRLRQQRDTLSNQATVELAWSEPLVTQEPRSAILINPFDISRPATAKMFFGRSVETETMQRELCNSEQGNALLLMGPRRSGKSSICKNFLERQVRAPFWGVLFSLQNATRHTEETILLQLAERVCQEFREQLQELAPDWQDYTDTDPQVRFRHILEHCISRVQGSRLVLVLDEFGGALESYKRSILDLRFFTYWKELLSEISQLSLVIVLPTSSHNLLTSKNFVNLFSFTQHLPVSFLDTESAKQLLVDPLREQSIDINPNTVALALKLTGGNPYYMTLIGQQLIHYLNKEIQQQIITDADLRLVLDQLIEEGSNQNFDFLKTELQSNDELHILEGIVELSSRTKQSKVQLKKIAAWLNTPVPSVRRHLDRLRVGLILDENGPISNPYYSFKIELVRRWLMRNRWFFSPARSKK